MWVGQSICVASTLMTAEEGQTVLPLYQEDGTQVGVIHIRLAALKKGKPEATRRRLSKWYGFRDAMGGRLLVEEDLRESSYAFDIPAKLLRLILTDRRRDLAVAERDLERYQRALEADAAAARAQQYVWVVVTVELCCLYVCRYVLTWCDVSPSGSLSCTPQIE